MDMCVDVTREDEFARAFNSPRALRDFSVVRRSDGGDVIVFDHERAIMNHCRIAGLMMVACVRATCSAFAVVRPEKSVASATAAVV